MLSNRIIAALAISILFTMPTLVFAETIAMHTGSADPRAEGWTLVNEAVGFHILAPVVNDLGSVDAWKIDTLSTRVRGDARYDFFLSDDQVNDALTHGWEMTARVRLIDVDLPRGQVIEFTRDAQLGAPNVLVYSLTFQTAPSDSDPIVILGGDGRGFLIDGGANEYHEYRLEDLDADGFATLHVDGTPVLEGYAPFVGGIFSGNPNRIIWGDVTSSELANGNINWASVQFRIVPEPSSIWLLAAALVLLFPLLLASRRSRCLAERESKTPGATLRRVPLLACPAVLMGAVHSILLRNRRTAMSRLVVIVDSLSMFYWSIHTNHATHVEHGWTSQQWHPADRSGRNQLGNSSIFRGSFPVSG